MLKFKVLTAVVRALSSVAAATKKNSAGGSAITPDERDEIIGAVLEAVVDLLDPMVDDARK
jgi:hypothetical protein